MHHQSVSLMIFFLFKIQFEAGNGLSNLHFPNHQLPLILMTYNYEDEDSDEDLIGVSEGIIKGIHGHIDEGFDENSKEG